MGWAKALWAREMGHDIYVNTEQQEQLYYARFAVGPLKPASSDAVVHFYGVFNAMHCNGGASGTGDIISINRRDLEEIKIRYRAYRSVNWNFDEYETRMALQIDESLEEIEKYFANTPPVLADETYFLIKQLAVPEGIAKRIAAYASTDDAEVSIDFR